MADRFALSSGSETRTLFTVDGSEVFAREQQDVDALLAQCAEERSRDVLRGHRRTGTFRCVMELPVVLAEALRASGVDIFTDREALRRVVNDPALAAFRTGGGRV